MAKKETKSANVFERLRTNAGLTRPEMAALMGLTDQTQIYKLERRNTKITTNWLEKYSLALNIPVTDIMSNKETINLDTDVVSISNAQAIPVYGMAAAGDPELVAINEDSIVEHVPFYWPTGTKAPKDAFGVTVRGESMLPRFQPNEVVIVDPHMSPRKNNDCVVEMVNGGASVKIYLGRQADKYHFSQYNTDILSGGKDNLIVMDVRQVKRVCAIVGHIIHR